MTLKNFEYPKYVEKSPELHKKIEAERVGESRLQSSSIKNIPSSNDNVNSMK